MAHISGFCFALFFLVFQDRGSVCSPAIPKVIRSVDLAGFEFRGQPAPTQGLGLKPCSFETVLLVAQLTRY